MNTDISNLGIVTYSGDAAFKFVEGAVYANAIIRKVGHIVSIHATAALPSYTQYVENHVGDISNPALRPITSIYVTVTGRSGLRDVGLGFATISNNGRVEYTPVTSVGLNWFYLDAMYMVAN